MGRFDIPIQLASVSQSERSSHLELLSQEAELGISDHLEQGGGARALRSVNPPDDCRRVRGQLVQPPTPIGPRASCPAPGREIPGRRKSPPEVFAQGCYRMNISFGNVANHFPPQAGVEAVPSSCSCGALRALNQCYMVINNRSSSPAPSLPALRSL